MIFLTVEVIQGLKCPPPARFGNVSPRTVGPGFTLRDGALSMLVKLSQFRILAPSSLQVILHVYVEDEQRLRCAVSGGVQSLIDTIRTKAPQMQVRHTCELVLISVRRDNSV